MDWKQIVINILVSGLSGTGAVYLFLKYFADKSIEYYKKEYQKDLQDYNLYSLKRNEIYSSLYEALQRAYGTLPIFHGHVNHPIRNSSDDKQLVYDYFRNTDLLDDNIKKIIDANLDRLFTGSTIGNNLKEINDIYYGYVVKGSIDKAQNIYVISSIYLDEKIDSKVDAILSCFRMLQITIYSRFGKEPIPAVIKDEQKLRDELDINFEELKSLMKKELFGK